MKGRVTKNKTPNFLNWIFFTETEGGVSQSPPLACPSPSKVKTSIFKQKTSILGSAILGSPKNDSSTTSLSSNKTASATMPLSEKPKSPSDAFDCESLKAFF